MGRWPGPDTLNKVSSVYDPIQRADMAMYQVKAEGRNNYSFYTCAMNERLAERLALQNEMRRALERKEFIAKSIDHSFQC